MLEFVVLCLDNQGWIVYVQAAIEVVLFWIPAFSKNTTLLMEVFQMDYFPELGRDVPHVNRFPNSLMRPAAETKVRSDQ